MGNDVSSVLTLSNYVSDLSLIHQPNCLFHCLSVTLTKYFKMTSIIVICNVNVCKESRSFVINKRTTLKCFQKKMPLLCVVLHLLSPSTCTSRPRKWMLSQLKSQKIKEYLIIIVIINKILEMNFIFFTSFNKKENILLIKVYQSEKCV